MKKLIWFVVFVAGLLPATRAQWQTVNYSLKGGWNAIYLHGDASHTPIANLFASNPEVIEAWRWNPNPSPVQINPSLLPNASSPEWSVWRRNDAAATTLTSLQGPNAYLILCSGAASDTIAVSITQKVVPPRATWVRSGANLLGFPTRLVGTYPTFSNYFATFPAAIAANSRIYRYAGGEITETNPVQVFSPASEPLDRNKAYWFEAQVVGNFYAPLEISPSSLDGLHYGRNGALMTVRVRNRTAATVTLTITPVESASPPTAQEAITGAVPLKRRTFVASPPSYTETAITTAFNEVIGPQSSVELSFVVDRTQVTGAPGAYYASLLRFTDASSLMEVYLPISARVTSLAGLWVGDVAVTDVSNQTPARSFTCDVANSFGSVASRAAAFGANSLRPISRPPGGSPYLYQWKRDGTIINGATNETLALTTSEAAQTGAFGSGTSRPYPFRVLLHVDDAGVARLLPQVFMGRLASPPNDIGLCTRETNLLASAKAEAARLVAVHLPLDAPITAGSGNVALGSSLVRTITLPFDDRTNPFVHKYHPDHDNKNARFEPAAEGVESYTVTRSCTFNFAPTPPAGAGTIGWGSSVLGGTYAETLTGLHKNPLTVTGTFELRRVSEIGTLITN